MRSMKTPNKKTELHSAARANLDLGRYLLAMTLLVLSARARAGDALTPDQIYEGGTNSYKNWIELSSGALLTQGNRNQAKQGEQHNTGVFGGIEDLHYETDVAKKTTFTLDGRSIFDEHDYSVGLGLVRDEYGFLRLNFENFRTWSSGNGGFLPSDGSTFSLPGDALALDRGRISFEAGLTKPNLPKITLKYSHWYRNGDEDSTLWGPVHDSSGALYRAYPGIYSLDEKSDTFQLDLAHHYKKINYGLGLSYTLGDLNDSHKLTFFDGEPAQQKVTDQQGTSYDLFSTHASADTWVKKNLFLSTGFLYSRLDDTFSGSRIYGDDFDVAYSPAYPALSYGYFNLTGGALKNDYIWNVNLMSLPDKDWTIIPSLRVQKEDWDANSAGTGTLDTGMQEPFIANSGRDSIDVTERLDFRYTGMTNWVFDFGGQWMEGQGNLHETNGLTQVGGIGIQPVLFATEDSRLFQKYFANARWYPLPHASLDFGGYYKINQYNYNNTQDSTPDSAVPGVPAYPGFLVYQDFETWDGNIRLTLRPWNNVMLVTRYEYQYSTIHTRPDSASGPGESDSSKMNSHIIGQNVSWTPLDWLGLQAGFNYVLSTTKAPVSDYTPAVLNAQNDYWTVNFNSDFVLSDKTDLSIGYFYYRAADSQNQIVGGLPLGTDADEHSITATLVHRITQNLRLNLKYAYTHYDDVASAGHFDYDAHVIFASLQYRF